MTTSMVKDAAELFGSQIPQVLKHYPDKVKEINAVYFFNITGAGGGQWTVDLAAAVPAVSQGDAGNAQCTIEAEHDDFMSMLVDPQRGMQLYFDGKLKLVGDPILATQLQRLFELSP